MSTYVGLQGLNHSSQVRVPAVTELDESVSNPVATVGGGALANGGSFASGTEYYKVTALGQSGESLPSTEVSGAVTATNEVQQLVVDSGAGTFDISFGGQTATNQAFNILAATLQTNLRALSSINGANVTVTGGVGAAGGGTPYVITFIGTLANTNVATITTSATNLSGTGAHTAAVSTTTQGGSAQITIDWTAVVGAVSYRVYRGTSTGAQDHYFAVTAPTHTFVDSGTTGTAGTVPTTHTAVTSGGWQNLTPTTVTIVNVDDIQTRKTLNYHSSFGQYVVAAVNTSTATAGTLPTNT